MGSAWPRGSARRSPGWGAEQAGRKDSSPKLVEAPLGAWAQDLGTAVHKGWKESSSKGHAELSPYRHWDCYSASSGCEVRAEFSWRLYSKPGCHPCLNSQDPLQLPAGPEPRNVEAHICADIQSPFSRADTLTCSCTHTLSHPHTPTLTHWPTHTHPHALAHTQPVPLTYPHMHTDTDTLLYTHTHTHTTCSHALTPAHPLSHTDMNTHIAVCASARTYMIVHQAFGDNTIDSSLHMHSHAHRHTHTQWSKFCFTILGLPASSLSA